MKTNSFLITIRLTVLFLTVLIACDPFGEDSLAKDKQVTFNQTEYYVLPGTCVVIDLKSFVSQSFIKAKLKITNEPTRGHLSTLDTLLLRYQPDTIFREGSDQFTITILSKDKVITRESISIYMKESIEEYPCQIYAVEDIAFAKPDSSITIRFLNNDRICGQPKAALSTSVHLNPRHGVATLVKDSIIYKPGSAHFEGDTMVYVVASSNQTLNAYGVIIIRPLVNDEVNCPFVLMNSYSIDLTDNISESIISTDCGAGYEFPIWKGLENCLDPTISLGPFISQTGGFCFSGDGRILFMPGAQSSESPNAQIKICVNGLCKDVTLSVIMEAIEFTQGWSLINAGIQGIEVRYLHFVDEFVGYINGASGIFKTLDGGKNWSKMPFQRPSKNGINANLHEFDFLDAQHGYVPYGISNFQTKTYGGGVLTTIDGGQSWKELAKFSDYYVYSVDFVSPQIGFIAVEDFSSGGVHILKTSDGGVSWGEVLIPGGWDSFPTIRILNDGMTGYVHYFARIYKTIDQGKSWQISYDNIQGNTSWTIPYFAVASTSGVILVEDLIDTNFPIPTTELYRSENGVSWQKVNSDFNGQVNLSPKAELGIHFKFTNEIFISKDQGFTWSKADVNPQLLSDFPLHTSIPTENVAYILGTGGKILRYVKEN
jgi:photosystem II stability/assembly factor-like uncharacterized protein